MRGECGLFLGEGDFVDAALVAASKEISVEERVNQFDGFLRRDKTPWQHKHVGVVVLACKLGDWFVPTQGGPYVLVLVEGHCHALACAAHCYSRITPAALNGGCAWGGLVGEVAAGFAVGAKVFHGNALCCEIANDMFLDLKTCVVAANGHWQSGF